MTALATLSPVVQDLTVFDTTLQLGESEPLGVGVKRVTMEQLELAARGFFDPETPFGPAVHESRKCVKRVRAMLRLIEGELPEKVYHFENQRLRDTARLIAEVRSAQGVVNAATSIRGLYADLLADSTFDEMIVRLERRRDFIELKTLEDPNLVDRVVRGLEKAYNRYSSWPTDSDAREVYGLGIRDSYQAIEPGLTATYQTGRHAMVRAYRRRGPRDFHNWRKRVKDLRHQMEFLAPLWPEVVVGTAMTLDRLGDILGDDNDLAESVSLLGRRHDLCPNPRERSLFRALVAQHRSELHIASEILGRRVYAEKPASLSMRYSEYWESRQMALGQSLDTIVVY